MMNPRRLIKTVHASSLWVSPLSLLATSQQLPDLASSVDVSWYQRRHREATPTRDVGAYVQHYVANVRHSRLSPNLAFDEEWYLHRYPAVRKAVNAGEYRCGWEQYLRIGASEFLNPTPWFDELWYQAHTSDASRGIQNQSLLCGYEHYLQQGIKQDLAPSIYFDPAWYRERFMTGDECGPRSYALPHFLLQDTGQSPNPFFDSRWYAKRYLIGKSGEESSNKAFRHYLLSGRALGYSPSPLFNESAYRAAYTIVDELVKSETYMSGFEHFVSEGVLKGFLAPTHLGTSGVDYTEPDFLRNYERSVCSQFRQLTLLRELKKEVARVG